MNKEYWERCWGAEDPEELCKYLKMYQGMESQMIDIFKKHNVARVCDAACGFGAFYMAFHSNGFDVCGFDISETAVELAVEGLEKLGMKEPRIKVADIFDTGYADGAFDGVIAHAVLDHVRRSDVEVGLNELFRIVPEKGLLLASFDLAEKADFEEEHVLLEDGTMMYVDGERCGMLFYPYSWEEIETLFTGHEIIFRSENSREKTVIVEK